MIMCPELAGDAGFAERILMMSEQVRCPVCDIPLTKPGIPTHLGEFDLYITAYHGEWEIDIPLIIDDPIELLFQKLRERHEQEE